MIAKYKLIAVPFLKNEGEVKGALETVTFIAASEAATHKWWCVNVGTFEKDFQRIVSPELAKHATDTLKSGKTFEFQNFYELDEVKGGFGGRWE
jgi:hypothetical protein